MDPIKAARIRVLLRRLKEWEEAENSDNQWSEELLLDIQQCLESIMEDVA